MTSASIAPEPSPEPGSPHLSDKAMNSSPPAFSCSPDMLILTNSTVAYGLVGNVDADQ
jgi:hypothetical protein